MHIFTLSDIESHLPAVDDLAEAIKQSYIDFSQKKYEIPPVGCLSLPYGEMHIKYGRSLSSKYAAIKVASGSYINKAKGLPVSSGCILMIDTETGFPLALIQDEGLLTNIRTSVAGAMFAKHYIPEAQTMGIIGCGTQGYYQALHTCQMMGFRKILAFDHSLENIQLLAQKLKLHDIEVSRSESVEALCQHSDIITTVTPSKTGYLDANWLKKKTLINAFGCDTKGKNELKSNVLSEAAYLFADSYSQCVDHGELQYANTHIREKIVEFGDALASPLPFNSGIIVADYTGIASQDITIATMVYDKLIASK